MYRALKKYNNIKKGITILVFTLYVHYSSTVTV